MLRQGFPAGRRLAARCGAALSRERAATCWRDRLRLWETNGLGAAVGLIAEEGALLLASQSPLESSHQTSSLEGWHALPCSVSAQDKPADGPAPVSKQGNGSSCSTGTSRCGLMRDLR